MLVSAVATQTLRLGGVAALIKSCGHRLSRTTVGMCSLEPATQPNPSDKSSLTMLLLCWFRLLRPKHCVWAAWQHYTLLQPAESSHNVDVPTRANHTIGLPPWWPASGQSFRPLLPLCAAAVCPALGGNKGGPWAAAVGASAQYNTAHYASC